MKGSKLAFEKQCAFLTRQSFTFTLLIHIDLYEYSVNLFEWIIAIVFIYILGCIAALCHPS